MSDPYLSAFLQRLCAEDEAIAEQGIDIAERTDQTLVLTGCVASEARRDLIGERVRAELVGRTVLNEITIVPAAPPDHAEELS